MPVFMLPFFVQASATYAAELASKEAIQLEANRLRQRLMEDTRNSTEQRVNLQEKIDFLVFLSKVDCNFDLA
ncbi:unnamed protein product [Protopolystoma xenopodis]|uniref:Uncharacterized protein n=1 Tax=Protopolystoma xenopodis TaxID=117903 RepID=A0A3S5AKP1_9PLAT|nr:unnamed protein product [Protopolystoma xenopodis]